jgi:two-component system chemotaxis sensor kinase CheA
MTSSLDRDEFTAGYLIEADEHVRASITNLLACEAALKSGAQQHRMVRELFRSLHTLKGLSAMVGVEPIVQLAHEMETILRDADRATGKLSADGIELLLKGVRAIEQRLAMFGKHRAVSPAPRKLLAALAELQARQDGAPASGAATVRLATDVATKLSGPEQEQLVQALDARRRALRIDFCPSPERSARGISITSVRERLGALSDIVKVIPLSVPKSEQAPGGLAFALLIVTDADDATLASAASLDATTFVDLALDASTEASSEARAERERDDEHEHEHERSIGKNVVRVEVERLDDALEKLSALVVTRFKLANAIAALRERGVDVRELSTILTENHRQLRDLRKAITRARMVSVAELLERVPLIVRGMSKSTGKSVRLVLDAGRAELDKNVAERVFPAIVHLVRNAVDHAIELPSERASLGKPEEGTITVRCFEHSDTQLELSVSDDGRGIDAGAVARRAGRSAPKTEGELLDLITLPGLSTLASATSNSGRGMGMDIVRRIAREVLGGELALRTSPGAGSTFTMRLPLSISIVDSFSFLSGGQSFVVPVSIVDEIIDLGPANIVQPPAPSQERGPERGKARTRLLERRGEAIPLFTLASVLSLAQRSDVRGKAFIVRLHEQSFAFAIDRVLSQQEIVLRPIEDPLVKVAGVAGTTDLGDGKPTLVLDLIGLSTIASNAAAAEHAA